MNSRKRNIFKYENEDPEIIRKEQEKKRKLQEDWNKQIQEKNKRKEKEKEELAEKEKKLQMKQQMKEKVFKERMEKNKDTIQNHVRKKEEKQKNKTNSSVQYVLNSGKNMINTALSKQYIMKHKETKDYNTLTNTNDAKPDIIRSNSGEQKKLLKLTERLKKAKKNAFHALEAKTESQNKLFDLRNTLSTLKKEKEVYMMRLKEALKKTTGQESTGMGVNMSIPFLCETNFVPINGANEEVDFNVIDDDERENSPFGNKFSTIKGKRQKSSKKTVDMCEKEISDLQDILDNYYNS